MEGGLALMCFRMLFWACSLALVFSRDFTEAKTTIKIIPGFKTNPCEGDRVTLRCEISSMQKTNEISVEWRNKSTKHQAPDTILHVPVDETGLTGDTDKRFSSSLFEAVNSTADLYSHTITINPVQKSDTGHYQCLVTKNQHTVNSSIEFHMVVQHCDEFPVCFPDGPDKVTIGSSLSCKMSSDIVSNIVMSTATNDGWVTSPTHAEGSPVQELTKIVTNSEHGKTFHCYSTPNVSAMALACTIGPLTVVSGSTTVSTTELTDPPTTAQPFPEYIVVLIVGIVIILITVILLFLCCHYDPRLWQQLRGMLGRCSTPRQGIDQSGKSQERGYETPYAVPRTAAPGTTSSTPVTTRHVYQNEIIGPTSSS